MSWFSKTNRAKASRNSRKQSKLHAQRLENREMMAGDLGHNSFVPEINVHGSTIEIQGTWLSDQSEVEVSDRGTPDLDDDIVLVRISNSLGSDVQTFQKYDAQGNNTISEIIFRGYGGDDRFENNSDLSSRAYGGAGKDRLVGGSAVDYLFGQSGDDQLFGNDGNDRLYGNSGNDLLWGQYHDDLLFGGSGNDYMSGGQGEDTLRGSSGVDRMYGGGGNDLILGGTGNDFLYGHLGNDTLMGEGGDDRLYGQGGNDLMHGGDGRDTLFGGDHRDLLIGGDGADSIYGQDGDDSLHAGDADITDYLLGISNHLDVVNNADDDDDDDLYGGQGDDTFTIGDHGFFEIGHDSLKDYTFGEQINRMDQWTIGLDFDPSGIETISFYGHLYFN